MSTPRRRAITVYLPICYLVAMAALIVWQYAGSALVSVAVMALAVCACIWCAHGTHAARH